MKSLLECYQLQSGGQRWTEDWEKEEHNWRSGLYAPTCGVGSRAYLEKMASGAKRPAECVSMNMVGS